MRDDDYWKYAYEDMWDKADEREQAIAQLIEKRTGKKVRFVGFGAGSSEFLSGSAASRGYEKGEADLEVEGTRIRLEVTGPHVRTVGSKDPLWVRPDKIRNARLHLKDHDTWVIHCLERDKLIRVIRLDDEFYRAYDQDKYSIVHPHIRGREETYVAVPSNDSCVQDLSVLIREIKSE